MCARSTYDEVGEGDSQRVRFRVGDGGGGTAAAAAAVVQKRGLASHNGVSPEPRPGVTERLAQRSSETLA